MALPYLYLYPQCTHDDAECLLLLLLLLKMLLQRAATDD